MAASGQLTCKCLSVDYGGGTGGVEIDAIFNWYLNDNNDLSLSLSHMVPVTQYAETWGLCGSTSGYYILSNLYFSEDGSNWTTIGSGTSMEMSICPTTTNIYNVMQSIMQSYGTYRLDKAGYIKISFGGNRAPAPSASLPHAFPSEATS